MTRIGLIVDAGSTPAVSTIFASVAQLVEHLVAIQKAVGSNPIARSMEKNEQRTKIAIKRSRYVVYFINGRCKKARW